MTSFDGLSSKFSLWKPPLHRYTQTEKTCMSRLVGKDERQQEGIKELAVVLRTEKGRSPLHLHFRDQIKGTLPD